MSFSNHNLHFSREVILFGNPPTSVSSNDSELDTIESNIPLAIHGQGVFIFKIVNAFDEFSKISIALYEANQTNTLLVELTVDSIYLKQNELLLTKQQFPGLDTYRKAFYWLSLDAQNQIIRFGIGEARLETLIFVYHFSHQMKAFLESLSFISFDNKQIKPLRLLRDPIMDNIPLKIKDTNELTMDMIATNAFMPKANLSSIARKLYDNIAGEKFILNTSDFPDFVEAIEYSIATSGCWCNQKLIDKAGEFGDSNPKKVYLRITLGQNGGESPGIPYVMEIWPAGCYSPIHNHAGANAIIRVLHGEVNVQLFPYLGAQEKFAETTFLKGDITWISPTLNQFHKLKNPNENGPTCITIQCYMYDESDLGHYDYFDYISENGEVKQYEPDSDMDFVSFKALMQEEWMKK